MRACVNAEMNRLGCDMDVGGRSRQNGLARVLAACVAMVCLGGAVDAHAFDLDDILHADALTDPLQATPAVLRSGALLPGDAEPVSCVVSPEIPPELSLETAIDLAMCGNPQVRAAWAAIKVQAGAVGEARAAYLPTLTGSVSRLNDRTWFPGSTNAATHTVGNTVYAALTWRLLDFGGRAANLSAARSLLEAASATYDAALQKTLTAVIQAYFDVQTAQASLVAKQEAVSIATETLQTARRKEQRGAGSNGDTLQAETTRARASLDRSRAEGDLNKAKAVLVYAMGMPPGSAVSVMTLGPPRAGELGASLARWLEQAQQSHPAIEAARAQIEAARARADVARSEGMPSLDLSASFYQNGRPGQGLNSTQTRERLVGVTLNLPIFEGFARTYKIRGADALVEQRAAELMDVEHRVAMDVVQAYSDAAAALGNLEASDALLRTAQSSLASSQRRYEKGAADVLEILSIQKALADAQQERIRCISEWRSASLRVVSAAGQLGVEKVREAR